MKCYDVYCSPVDFNAYLNAHQCGQVLWYQTSKGVLNKWPLCQTNIMPSLLYVSIAAKRANFSMISRVVNSLMT